MSYSVTTSTTKIAWRRDPSVPAGQPALGSFRCVCGYTITGVGFGSEPNNLCRCGRLWDGHGWLVGEPAAIYRIAATNSSQARYGVDLKADTEAAALDAARHKSTEFPGVSFGVFEVHHGEGAFIVASFLNGERTFTATV